MVRYPDSVDKLLQYFIRLDNYQVFLSPKFFQSVSCPVHCGACCPAFTLDYFLCIELDTPPSDKALVSRRKTIKGREVELWSLDNDLEKKHCSYLDGDGGCIIHEYNPLSCRIEPIKIKLVGDIVYILRQPFGRAWNLTQITGEKGALCAWNQYNSEQWDDDIQLLERFRAVGNYLGYDCNALSVLIGLLHKYRVELCRGMIPKEKICLNRGVASKRLPI